MKHLTKITVLSAVLLLATAASVQASNPGVLPPQSHPHGKSYGEWSVAFWQWILSIPADRNPLTDPDASFAGEGQSGSVWFLAGSFGESVQRASTIPKGKSLLVAVWPWIFGSGAFDCDPSVPGVPCDVAALTATAAWAADSAEVLQVSIDGVPVENVAGYRSSSPGPFGIVYPENSVTGLPAGAYYPQVADGYFLMLAPLTPGYHTIVLHVESSATDIDFTIVHHLTVE